MLILSEHRFKTAGKYLLLYVACFALERIALVYLSGSLSFIVLCDYIYHDTIGTWHHDRRMADLINFRQRIYQCDGAYAHHRKLSSPCL
ncbi:MAG: hypothetical protein ACLRWH_09560 [Emergencia sp.]